MALVTYGLVSLQSGLLAGGFRCQGLDARGVFLNVLVLAGENGAAFVTAGLGGGIEAVALAYLGGRLAGVALTALLLRLASPWLMVARWRSSWANVRAVVHPPSR